MRRLPPREEVDHSPGRPQHWSDVDVDLRDWSLAIVDRTARLEPIVAVFLHGSLAIGSYFRPKSDVDLLVVADGPARRGRAARTRDGSARGLRSSSDHRRRRALRRATTIDRALHASDAVRVPLLGTFAASVAEGNRLVNRFAVERMFV